MRQQMEEEQWDLCRLLDAALHGRPAEMLPPAEKYGAILELADRHRVLPLLYDVLAPKLPEEDENRKRLEKRRDGAAELPPAVPREICDRTFAGTWNRDSSFKGERHGGTLSGAGTSQVRGY